MKNLKKVLSFMFATLFVVALVVGATTKNENVRNGALTVQAAEVAGAMIGRKGGGRYATAYNMLKDKYKTNIVSKGELAIYATLENSKGEYFFVLNTEKGDGILDKKLHEQDGFRVLDIGLFLVAEDKTIPGINELHTFPNPNVFVDEVGGFQSKHLYSIYNGTFELTIGDTVYVRDLPARNNLLVNTAQQQSAGSRSEIRPEDGFQEMTPQFTFRGRENNKLRLKVPSNQVHRIQTQLAATPFTVKVVCILKGFYITGAGDKQPATEL